MGEINQIPHDVINGLANRQPHPDAGPEDPTPVESAAQEYGVPVDELQRHVDAARRFAFQFMESRNRWAEGPMQAGMRTPVARGVSAGVGRDGSFPMTAGGGVGPSGRGAVGSRKPDGGVMPVPEGWSRATALLAEMRTLEPGDLAEHPNVAALAELSGQVLAAMLEHEAPGSIEHRALSGALERTAAERR